MHTGPFFHNSIPCEVQQMGINLQWSLLWCLWPARDVRYYKTVPKWRIPLISCRLCSHSCKQRRWCHYWIDFLMEFMWPWFSAGVIICMPISYLTSFKSIFNNFKLGQCENIDEHLFFSLCISREWIKNNKLNRPLSDLVLKKFIEKARNITVYLNDNVNCAYFNWFF